MASTSQTLVSRLKVFRNVADRNVKNSLQRQRWCYDYDQAQLRDLLDDTIQHLERNVVGEVRELVFE